MPIPIINNNKKYRIDFFELIIFLILNVGTAMS